MASGFNIFRKFEDGEILLIAWRQDMEQAEQLAREFMENWPGEYGIQPEGSDEPISWLE